MNLFIRRLFLILALGFNLGLFSAPAPPPGGAGGPGCWPPPCVPIDGGIGLLMAAGAVYGAKKFRDKRKKSSKSL